MKLSSSTKVPPSLFRFRHPISGHEEAFHSWALLRSWVTEHCAANGYPPVTDAEIESQICERLGPKVAERYCEGEGASVRGVGIGWREVWAGTKVLAANLLAGSPRVPQEEAERRASICAGCPRNTRYSKPCGGNCPELREVVQFIVGPNTTSHDAQLEACSVCLCDNKSQIWLPIEHLAKGVTPEMMPKFTDSCWKRLGIEALNEENAGLSTKST